MTPESPDHLAPFSLLTSADWRDRRRREDWHWGTYLRDIQSLRDSTGNRIDIDLPVHLATSYAESLLRAPYKDFPSSVLWTLLVLNPELSDEYLQLAELNPEPHDRLENLLSLGEWCTNLDQPDTASTALICAASLYKEGKIDWEPGSRSSRRTGIRLCIALASRGIYDEAIALSVVRSICRSVEWEKANPVYADAAITPAARVAWADFVRYWVEALSFGGSGLAPIIGANFLTCSDIFEELEDQETRNFKNEIDAQITLGLIRAGKLDEAEARLNNDVGEDVRTSLVIEYFEQVLKQGLVSRFHKGWTERGNWLAGVTISEPRSLIDRRDAICSLSILTMPKLEIELERRGKNEATFYQNALMVDQFIASLWCHRFDEASRLLHLLKEGKGANIGVFGSPEELVAERIRKTYPGWQSRPPLDADYGSWLHRKDDFDASIVYWLTILGQDKLVEQLAVSIDDMKVIDFIRFFVGAARIAQDLAKIRGLDYVGYLLTPSVASGNNGKAGEVLKALQAYALARDGQPDAARVLTQQSSSQVARLAWMDGVAVNGGYARVRELLGHDPDVVPYWHPWEQQEIVACALTMLEDFQAAEDLLTKAQGWNEPDLNKTLSDLAGVLSTQLSAKQLAERMARAPTVTHGKIALTLAKLNATYAADYLKSAVALLRDGSFHIKFSLSEGWYEPIADSAESPFAASGDAGADSAAQYLEELAELAELMVHLLKMGDTMPVFVVDEQGVWMLGQLVIALRDSSHDAGALLSALAQVEGSNALGFESATDVADYYSLMALAVCVFHFHSSQEVCRAEIMHRYNSRDPEAISDYSIALSLALSWGMALCNEVTKAEELLAKAFDVQLAANPELEYWFTRGGRPSLDKLKLLTHWQLVALADEGVARERLAEQLIAQTTVVSILLELAIALGTRDTALGERVKQRAIEIIALNSETSISSSPTHGSEDPLEETQNDHEPESVDNPREESEDDFMMLKYAALFDAREGGARWLELVAPVIRDEQLRAGILNDGDQAESEDRLNFVMWAPSMEFEVLLDVISDSRWSKRDKTWPRDRLLSIAAETRVPEQWLVLAACLKQVNDIPMRMQLWRECVDAIPEAELSNLTQALLSREESDARDDRISGLAIIANRLSQSHIDLPDEISPDEIVTHLLGSIDNGVTIWSKPRTRHAEIYGKVNPVLAQSWGLAVLYRYLDSDYFVDKRRNIGELLVNKLRELLESDLWRDGDTVWDLQTVLETIGDEDIIADTRRLFSQLKAQGWT